MGFLQETETFSPKQISGMKYPGNKISGKKGVVRSKWFGGKYVVAPKSLSQTRYQLPTTAG